MIVSIHQPQYLPWLGYFEKMDRADVFVFLDDVQFTKNDWQNRNKIRTAEGWQWLTVPVLHHFGQTINETRIDERTPWPRKHLRSIDLSYGRAPFFSEYREGLAPAIEGRGSGEQNLTDVCLRFIEFAVDRLKIGVQMARSSSMTLPEGATERLVAICKHFRADVYYSGAYGRHYLDVEQFKKERIEVLFQEYHHPTYRQGFEPFIPSMSVIDLMFNEGPRSLDIVRSGVKPQGLGVKS